MGPALRIAREILMRHGGELHYLTITDKILEVGGSGLGRRGVTPSQTVGSMLRSRPDVFFSRWRGYYGLRYRNCVIAIDVSIAKLTGVIEKVRYQLSDAGCSIEFDGSIPAPRPGSVSESCCLTFRGIVDVQRWYRDLQYQISQLLAEESQIRRLDLC